jgi:hypothetical protein
VKLRQVPLQSAKMTDVLFFMCRGVRMTTQREAWLNLTMEEALEPELPICDPHHHLWDYTNNRYLLDELLRDTGRGHRVV